MTAEVCPVCEGRGTLPSGFYEPPARANAGPVTCRTCGGRGALLSEGAEPIPADPLDLTYRPE